MTDIQKWLDIFCAALSETFRNRIWFVGLQGSYGRNEATDESDIDVVVILDTLQPKDITRYREMLETLPCREKSAVSFRGKQNCSFGSLRIYFSFIMIPHRFKAV